MSVKFLYEFTYKANKYYYCTGNKNTVHAGITYKATYIAHSRIVTSVDETLNEASIFTDIENDIIAMYLDFIPTSSVDVNIKRLRNGIANPIFWGNVIEVTITNDYESEIKIAPLTSRLDKVANRWTYQSNCNHFVYSTDCGVDSNLFSFITTVTAMSEDGIELTVNDIAKSGVTDQTWLIGGKIVIEATGASSKIVNVKYSENKIILLSYFRITVGTEVRLFAGCNKTRNHCAVKFNNLSRQMAKNYVPGRDPTKGI